MGSPFTTVSTFATVDAATDGQLNFIHTLLTERAWNDATVQPAKHIERAASINVVLGWLLGKTEVPMNVRKYIDAGVTDGENVNNLLAKPLTKTGASALIEWLKTVPKCASSVSPETDILTSTNVTVPAGRYAVETEPGAVNTLAFYKVDRPTEGRWAGHVFVKHIVSSEEHRLSRAAGEAVLRKIAAVGAEAASARYGQELEHCGVCGRPLTNDDSRERGIGPKCAADMGW